MLALLAMLVRDYLYRREFELLYNPSLGSARSPNSGASERGGSRYAVARLVRTAARRIKRPAWTRSAPSCTARRSW